MIVGSKGQITLLNGFFYKWIRQGCKNLYIKLIIHSIGLIVLLMGISLFICYIVKPLSVLGIFLSFIGLFLFLTPFGIEN